MSAEPALSLVRNTGPLEVRLMTVTKKMAGAWLPPPFQRPVSLTKNFREMVHIIDASGMLVSAIYLGLWEGRTYVVDGRHRLAGLAASDRDEILIPTVTIRYRKGRDGLVQMCEDFMVINKHVKSPSADDLLRALETTSGPIRKIRQACPFIGYANLWVGKNPLVVNMARAVRSLVISRQDIPGSTYTGGAAIDLAKALTKEEVDYLIGFMRAAYEAWGADKEFRMMWSASNLTLCLWFYRRMVGGTHFHRSGSPVPEAKFSQLLIALVANPRYRELIMQLKGRRLHAAETRNPIAREMLRTFSSKLDAGERPPSPTWLS